LALNRMAVGLSFRLELLLLLFITQVFIPFVS
jgi:hypothetical protein